MKSSEKTDIYLDYAAATPLLPAVKEAMEPYWSEVFANPQAVHDPGKAAAKAVAAAKDEIASMLDVQPSELIITSGATESNALALLGVARAYREKAEVVPEIILSAIAHSSVAQIGKSHKDAVLVKKLPVDERGELVVATLPELLSDRSALLSVEYVNSEVGAVQPIQDLSEAISSGGYPLFHVDASQAADYFDIRPHRFGADLMTINAHKLGGPKGVGLLWVRSGTPLAPLFIAGSSRQVGDYGRLRPGTPPTPLIVGFQAALRIAHENYEENSRVVSDLQAYCMEKLTATFADVRLNGSLNNRAPHIINITFPDTDHDFLAAKLAAHGVAVSTTSACQSESGEGSVVLSTMSPDDPRGLRISLSTSTTRKEIDVFLEILTELLKER